MSCTRTKGLPSGRYRVQRIHLGRCLGGPLRSRIHHGPQARKLPAEVIEETYAKEYGTDTIQLHKDAISKDDVVLLHDDLLATGGTMAAAYRLVKTLRRGEAYVNFVIELKGLNGRNAFEKDVEVTTLLEL